MNCKKFEIFSHWFCLPQNNSCQKKKIHVIVQKIFKKIIWLKGYGHLSVMISIVPMESCTEVWQNKVGIFKNTGFQSNEYVTGELYVLIIWM